MKINHNKDLKTVINYVKQSKKVLKLLSELIFLIEEQKTVSNVLEKGLQSKEQKRWKHTG